MSRKNKIIVSVVGIIIVTLALLGITYAYYLTRIEGNTNTNSISLTTANLLLKYDDGSGAIVEENIMPGVTFTKTFSVTNEGNATIDNYVVYLEDVINDLSRTQDLTYTLTCDNCTGSNGVYPKLAGIIATNSIAVGETHNYTLKVTYENLTDTDQSIDMGSTINGYIQIYNLTDIVDITGSVTNATDGDYVQINSEPKISQIVDGKYMLGGVEPGSHTITVRYKDSNGDEQIRSTKEIVIQKGNTTKVEDNVITVTNDSQTVTINVDATNANNYQISNTIKDYDPYQGTLAVNFSTSQNINLLTNKIVEDREIATKALAIPFSITNISDEHRNITIKLKNIEMDEALKNVDFRWGLYNADTNKGLSFGIFKYTGKEELIYTDTIIDAADPDITKNYILRIWVHNNGTAQTALLNKNFKAKVSISSETIEYTAEECFNFDLNSSITGFNRSSCDISNKVIVIPKTISGITVSKIDTGETPFFGYESRNHKRVIIPDTVEYINTNAFYSGGFGTEGLITLPESLHDLTLSLYSNKISTIFIPEINNLDLISLVGTHNLINYIVLPGSGTRIGEWYIDIQELVLMEGFESIDYVLDIIDDEVELPRSTSTIVGFNDVGGQQILGSAIKKFVYRGSSIPSGFSTDWNCINTDYDENWNMICKEHAEVELRP